MNQQCWVPVNEKLAEKVSEVETWCVRSCGLACDSLLVTYCYWQRLNPRSWGASTPMKMCNQADLDTTGALRHMNKNNSARSVCRTHSLPPTSTSFLFVFDAEWVMSTCEHQGRDTVLHTCLKLHWSRRSASSCFNRVWRVTISSAKHQSMLSPWVMQH